MKLFDYIIKKGVGKRHLSNQLKINESTLYKYINREREPKLQIAIRIVELTKGQVGFKDLLLKRYEGPKGAYETTLAGRRDLQDEEDDFL